MRFMKPMLNSWPIYQINCGDKFMSEEEGISQILEQLKEAITDIAKAYKCSMKDCGLTFHPTGVVTLDVKGEPIYYFFNTDELIKWVQKKV